MKIKGSYPQIRPMNLRLLLMMGGGKQGRPMCGRYQLDVELESGAELLGAILEADFEPRYNAAPMQMLPVVRRRHQTRSVAPLRWGLVPDWANDESFAHKLINARSETVVEKPAFKAAFRFGRCLVPTTGFYEWKTTGRYKQPHLISMRSTPIFAMAGLWSPWSDGNQALETFTVLTVDPRDALAGLHDRMPVILDPGAQQTWLNPESSPQELTALLQPRRADELKIFPVSERVNSVKNDDPACARAVPVQQSLI